MLENNATTTTPVTAPVKDTRDAATIAQGFWSSYSKPIIYVGTAIILIIGGWLIYKQFVKLPQEKKANESIFMAENIFDKMAANGFNKDSAVIVLNGGVLEGAKVNGVLSVIRDFGGTMAGNRATFIAGATYLHIKEFDKAIKYLKDFDANGAHQVQSKAYILLGHAYAEQNKTEDALSNYKKASTLNDKDDVTTGEALLIAGSYADAIGKNEEAISLYKKLRDNYPTNVSVRSGEVDKYLARLGVFN